MFSGKNGSVRVPCHKLQMSFWYSAVVELKSFGFSCVVVGQQHSLNFIPRFGMVLVSVRIATPDTFTLGTITILGKGRFELQQISFL